MLHLWIFFKLP